jgi:autotransporter-associated beta strand protein
MHRPFAFSTSLHLRRASPLLTLLCVLVAARAQTVTYNDGDTNTSAQTVPVTLDIATGTATQSGDISGTGTLTKTGAGTIILSGDSTYTGTTLISAGTLQLQRDDPFASTSAIGTGNIVNNGALAANFTYFENFSGTPPSPTPFRAAAASSCWPMPTSRLRVTTPTAAGPR